MPVVWIGPSIDDADNDSFWRKDAFSCALYLQAVVDSFCKNKCIIVWFGGIILRILCRQNSTTVSGLTFPMIVYIQHECFFEIG